MKNTVIVNAISAPGAGKSTLCGSLFGELKMRGYDVEYIQEFAKSLTWEKNREALRHQYYVTATQMYMQNVLVGQVEAVITDSPVLLGCIYNSEANPEVKEALNRFIITSFKAQNNLNLFVRRTKVYNSNGRSQTFEEAKALDDEVIKLLTDNGIPFVEVTGDRVGLLAALKLVMDAIRDAA